MGISIEGAINFVRRSSYLAFVWPLPRTATEFHRIIFDVLWTLSLLNLSYISVLLIYSAYNVYGDSFMFTSSVCYATCYGASILQYLIFKLHRNRLKSLTSKMDNYLKIAKPHEREILQSYIKKCFRFYLPQIIWNYLAVVIPTFTPIFMTDQKVPLAVIYPVSVDSQLTKYFIQIHQLITAISVAALPCAACQAAMLMWFIGARLEILAAVIEKIRNRTELCNFIRNHQHVLKLANDIATPVSHIAFMSVLCSCVVLVSSSLQLVSSDEFAVKMQFGPLAIVTVIGLFICAWPAENLIRACDLVGIAAYNGTWLDMSLEMRKGVLIILQRSQRPVIVSIGGFIPTLSLRYYGGFISAALSYFMTLRAIVDANKA